MSYTLLFLMNIILLAAIYMVWSLCDRLMLTRKECERELDDFVIEQLRRRP